MSVIKYSPFALRHVDRDEFLTPFDRVFDEVFANHFPELTKELGVGFFEKQSYPRVDVVDYSDRVEILAESLGSLLRCLNSQCLPVSLQFSERAAVRVSLFCQLFSQRFHLLVRLNSRQSEDGNNDAREQGNVVHLEHRLLLKKSGRQL